MLTPQEVSEHAFAKASFGGYNMAMVDEFLDQLTADYTALFKENAVLKNKMKVLVDKVEEYRSTEDAMRQTLLSAQKMASSMVEEAEAKKATLLQEAEEEARAKLQGLREEYDHEQYRLEAARQRTAQMVAQLRELIDRETVYLDELANVTAPQAPRDFVGEAAQQIEQSLTSMEDTAEIHSEPEDEPEIPPLSPKEEEYTPRRARSEHDDDATAPTRRLEDDEVDALLDKLRNGEKLTPGEFDIEDSAEDEPWAAPGRIDFDNLEFGENYKL